jgi:pimeloyl-ACP methyl ester carboxylesterase
MPMAQVKGGDIHYTVMGEGPPLVMLLPQSSGPVGIAPFFAKLSERFLVIRYDQRGTGQSAPVSSPDGMSMAFDGLRHWGVACRGASGAG